MTLRKITIDNSIRYIPKNEQTKEKNSKPKTIKRNKKPSQNNKKFLKNISASGFKYITK